MDVFEKMNAIAETPQFSMIFSEDSEQARKIAEHREWLKHIRHERPNTEIPYRVGVYIRYFNQTRYENYLDYHKKQFADTLALCPQWTLVDFYIDEGSTAPNMESAPAWSQLLDDNVTVSYRYGILGLLCISIAAKYAAVEFLRRLA